MRLSLFDVYYLVVSRLERRDEFTFETGTAKMGDLRR
jgi:hypothetical protein